MSVVTQALLVLRPKQWTKNFLMFVAPFAAGVNIASDFLLLAIGFATFSIASSIGYVVNDLNDIEIDRVHPTKVKRPFASGILSIRSGYLLLILLSLMLLSITFLLPSEFNLILCVYLINTFVYTKFIKIIPVVELFAVAFGFILRMISGALLLDLAISEWFLLVGGFGALYVVCAKRLAEFKMRETRVVRQVVSQYTEEFLHSSITASVSVSSMAYCLWAFNHESHSIWFQLSVIPFVIALFRYRWLSESTVVEIPEDVILGDKTLVILAFGLLTTLMIAIY
jgi:decaprenyl-phosphate phosphoribosyltransferase